MANPKTEQPTSHVHDSVAHTLALLQPWIEYIPPQQRRLGIFIVLALCIHAVAFFFIRIDSTRAELRHQARTHVILEYPKAMAVSGAVAGDIWDRLTDPRLYILPLNPLAGLTSDVPTPGLDASLGTDTLPPAAPPGDYRAPRPASIPLEQRVEADMSPSRQPFVYIEAPPAMALKTTWVWDDTLASLQPTGAPDLPSPISDTDLSPTVLRMAIGPNGDVQHVLIEHSSGELGAAVAKDLDAQAVLAARKVRFKPTNQPLTWGHITILWRYSAKPREEVLPTPPAAQ